jgi:dTDP-6-deoxy-L-talose 4-dehydrogenase (NAD+)
MLENGLKDLTVAGTCLEYGMKEGCLSEEMECDPTNSYAIAKNELRKQLQILNRSLSFDLKWVRLFYMYGRGQHSNSLVAQLEKSLENKEQQFNMSGGEQLRDFLPVEKVARYIVAIALQQQVAGIINCCSGIPVSVRAFVEEYLKERKKDISLNLGYYPYTDYEAMKFWGSNTKLKSIPGYE